MDLPGVRAALVLRGTSLHRWALAHGYRNDTTRLAVAGLRRGPLSRRIVAQLKQELSET